MTDDTTHGGTSTGDPTPYAGHRNTTGVEIPSPRNKAMQQVIATVERIAASDVNLIVAGEPGTGKEWTAHLIHRLSARSSGPFLLADCAVLTSETAEKELFGYEALTWKGIDIAQGLFEGGNGGTVLLNDIGSLPPQIQMKVFRAVEYRSVRRTGSEQDIPVDFRLIATLSEDPGELLRKDVLRKELYYAISSIVIEIPPLRERREDVPGLIEHFLAELRGHNGSPPVEFSEEAIQRCVDYDWPGNLRMLRNAVEYATVMSGGRTVEPEHLPAYVQKKRHG